MKSIRFFVVVLAFVALGGCVAAVDDIGDPQQDEQFYNGLSGEFMTWVECDGTDDIGPLPPEQFWAPAESDWIGAALGSWFSQGRCLGYPSTCSPICIGVDNDLDIDQPDFTPVDEIAGAGAPSTPIDDHGISLGDGAQPGDKLWACDGWRVFLVVPATTISFWTPGADPYATVVGKAIGRWQQMDEDVTCSNPYAIPGSNECRAWCWIVSVTQSIGEYSPFDETP